MIYVHGAVISIPTSCSHKLPHNVFLPYSLVALPTLCTSSWYRSDWFLVHVVRVAVRGLTYMVTDKGPQRQCLKEIGKTEDSRCVCDNWTTQNAAHLQRRPCIEDENGRSLDQTGQDEEWCAEVARFLK